MRILPGLSFCAAMTLPPDDEPADSGDSHALDLLAVRRAVGVAGLALPVVLMVGGRLVFGLDLEDSMSDYYSTGMRDVFVGFMCAIALFLFAYRGYGRKDFYLGKIAGVLAFLVAVVPNTGKTALVHIGIAMLFFVAVASISLFLFTKSDTDAANQRVEKRRHNRIYITCGCGILACLPLCLVYWKWVKDSYGWLDAVRPVFVLEALAVWFFAVSWLFKGKILRSGLLPKLIPRKVQDFFGETPT